MRDTPLSQSSTTPDAAASYRARFEWKVFTLKPGTKIPEQDGWQQFAQRPWEEISGAFMPFHNIGVMLGAVSGGLVDVDLDWPEARLLAAETSLKSLWSFGRQGQTPGHYIARCDDHTRITKLQFTKDEGALLGIAEDDKLAVAELRGNGQTMFPPSVHSNGERVVWSYCDGELPERGKDELLLILHRLAFLAVVLRKYPRINGSRDEICLALSGALLSAGMSADDADTCVRLVARLAGDEESSMRGKAQGTTAKQQNGEPTTGLPKLCELLGIEPLQAKLAKWLHFGAKPTAPLPPGAILVQGGKINELVATAERMLIDGGEPIFQRGELLTRPVRLDKREADKMSESDGVRRKPGSLVLLPVSQLWIVRALARQGTWYEQRAKSRVNIDPPDKLASHILDNVGDWRFAGLRSVVSTPTLRADGTILQTPGYDPASQLIYDPSGDFPLVTEHPTFDDARAALATFAPIFAGFPFATGADTSVLYAAILTALIRPSLRTAPLFAFNAPMPATGKSKLCECIGVIALGDTPPLINVAPKDDEFKKQLDSVLRRGDPVVWLDNVSRPLHGDTLCSMLTNPLVKIRILGLTEDVDCPANCVVLATGNNIAFQGDLCRRVLVCTLDANMERPDTRSFDFDPVAECRKRRIELVMAGLTILRAYIVAGRPTPTRLEPFGSFEDFNLVRGALAWLGMDDPCRTRLDVYKSDETRESLIEALAEWHKRIGDDPVTLKDIRDMWLNNSTAFAPLIDALKDATGQTDDRDFNAKRTGNALRRFKSIIAGGFKLEQPGLNRNKVALWQVTCIEREPSLPYTSKAVLPAEAPCGDYASVCGGVTGWEGFEPRWLSRD
jgi:hypothetical protein